MQLKYIYGKIFLIKTLKTYMKIKIQKIINFVKAIYQVDGKTFFRTDIMAWITVALVIIPQSMAYAGLAWLSIEVWLYTALLWTLIGGFLWSSKQMSTGPVTIVSLMTATAVWSLAISSPEQYIAYASILAFLIWIFYILLVTLRLWVIVEFLSHPVVIWFTNAIALVTIISQASKIFGISIGKWLSFIESASAIIITALSETHLLTFIFGFWWISLLIGLKKYYPKLPRVLILLVISIILSNILWYNEVFDWKVVWKIPNGLPAFWIPFMKKFYNLNDILALSWYAFIIWMIWFTESISVAKWVAARTKQKVSTNKELVSQWIANIWSSLFWWYWVAGSFSRTAVNLRSGAKTWLASIITWLIVWVTLLYLTPLLYHLPMATLAAIIIVAVSSLIKIEPILEAWKIQRTDAYTAIITFIATIVFSPNVENWILIWVIISLWLYINRSMRPKIVELSMYNNWVLRDANFFKLKTSKEVSIIRVDWPLFFANCSYFESKVIDMISDKKKLKIIIFDFEWMSNIDSSAYVVLSDFTKKLEKSWIKVYLSNMRVKVITKLHDVRYLEKIGTGRVFEKLEDVINFLNEKYKKKKVNVKPLIKYSPKSKISKQIWKKKIYKKIWQK